MAKKKTATTEYKTIKDWLERHPQKVRMQRAFKELCCLIEKEDKQNLDWWHAVGRQALILYPIDGQHFGQNFIQKLAKGLPSPNNRPKSELPTSYEQDRVNTLWSSRKLAHRFSKKKLQNLDRTLTVHHIMGLLTINNKNHKSWEKFAAECIAKGWSAHELRREIQNDRGVKSSAGGRRPKPKTTVTAAIAVRDLILSARRWLACYEQCLEGHERPLKNVPKAEFNKILLKEVTEAAELLKDVGTSVEKACHTLQSLAEKIQNVLDKDTDKRARGKTARSAKA